MEDIKREEDEESNYSALYDDVDEEEREERDPSAYYPKNKFPPARMVTRTVQELYDLLEDGTIDLEAEYQREVVWTDDRQCGLVTTLMEGYYVPPVLFNMKQHPGDPSKRTHVCVDGKQRLTSIRAFMKGLIPCKDDQDQKWYFRGETTGRAAGRRLLPEEARRHFSRRSLLCYEIENLERGQEEDLFARVQRGVALNEPEKLRASQGPWQELATQFESDFKSFINRSSNKRSHGWGNILSCFSQIMECEHPSDDGTVPKLKATSPSVRKLLESPQLLTPATRAQFTRVFTTLVELDRMDRFLFGIWSHGTKTFAPIEMVGVAVLVALHGEKRSHQMLQGDIRAFRDDIRRGRPDLRMNKNTWDAVWEWIDTVEARRGATDGTTTAVQPKHESDSNDSESDSSSDTSSGSESEGDGGDHGTKGQGTKRTSTARQSRAKPAQTKQQQQQKKRKRPAAPTKSTQQNPQQTQQRPAAQTTSTQQTAPASSVPSTAGLSPQQRSALTRKRNRDAQNAAAHASALANAAAQQNVPNKRVQVYDLTNEDPTATKVHMEELHPRSPFVARRTAVEASSPQVIPKRSPASSNTSSTKAAIIRGEPIMAATTEVRGGHSPGGINMTTMPMPMAAPMAPRMAPPSVPPNPLTMSPARKPASRARPPVNRSAIDRSAVPTTTAAAADTTSRTTSRQQKRKRAAPDLTQLEADYARQKENAKRVKMEEASE
ncbi:MAG: hypothetical protein M1823_000730 [Watsoniomyces obsoletus]|nr:MAG: hypothetical protein M1823_000730 [Watsoniomyces obsoletus]